MREAGKGRGWVALGLVRFKMAWGCPVAALCGSPESEDL